MTPSLRSTAEVRSRPNWTTAARRACASCRNSRQVRETKHAKGATIRLLRCIAVVREEPVTLCVVHLCSRRAFWLETTLPRGPCAPCDAPTRSRTPPVLASMLPTQLNFISAASPRCAARATRVRAQCRRMCDAVRTVWRTRRFLSDPAAS